MIIKFCYNCTLSNGGIVELANVEKNTLHKAQLYLEKHGVDISLTTISRTTQPKECLLCNQDKYIQQLQPQLPGQPIQSVSLEFVRA